MTRVSLRSTPGYEWIVIATPRVAQARPEPKSK
jgi:hypothetical protein